MAPSRNGSVARSASLAGARLVQEARLSVVEVRSGGRGAGAGVIWPGDGLVLTNNHVVADGRGRRVGVRVALHDGREYDAEVLKRSQGLDLALLWLREDANDLPVASVGDSDALRVGELVYAVGHPWGNPGTATAGIVSGRESSGRWSRRASSVRFVRSDVALAPGNSGGPLLNARGEVVGINAMIFGRTAISIPSNVAASWAAEPGEGRGGDRSRLGVGVVPVEFPASGRPEGGDAWGLAIHSLEEGGPAQAAGLLMGDVLLGLAGTGPQDVGPFQDALDEGGEISLRVLRGGETLVVEVPPRASGQAA